MPIPFNGLLFAAMSSSPDITTRSGFGFHSSVRNRSRSAPVSPSSGYRFKSRFWAGIFAQADCNSCVAKIDTGTTVTDFGRENLFPPTLVTDRSPNIISSNKPVVVR